MLALLRTRRWISFTVAALVAIIAFGLLSLWQWHRAEAKRAEFAEVATRMAATPTTPAAQSTDPSLDWRHVTLTGTYDADRQLLVRSRPQNGNGFWVLTPLTTRTGVTWVARGWLPTSGGATTSVTAPAPPPGNLTVTGFARLPEPGPVRAGDDLPAEQVTAVEPTGLSALVRSGAPSAWFVVADNDATLQRLDTPQPSDSRNLGYAGQWLLFAAITVAGWWYFLRREAQETTTPASGPAPQSVPANTQ